MHLLFNPVKSDKLIRNTLCTCKSGVRTIDGCRDAAAMLRYFLLLHKRKQYNTTITEKMCDEHIDVLRFSDAESDDECKE